ncbi:hypothetical protein RDI58_010376 [Solanum bulbocastanum]|uniref:Uncharacterized protein n=1 Tax=Solanum bulbocastanum TaxID=147425 RepID=A0AAN8TQE2_SOLBU
MDQLQLNPLYSRVQSNFSREIQNSLEVKLLKYLNLFMLLLNSFEEKTRIAANNAEDVVELKIGKTIEGSSWKVGIACIATIC